MYLKRVITASLLLFSLSACNFHEIDPGKLFRSAQLDALELEYAIEQKGIKTVINLRGPSQKEWYIEEKEMAEKHGVQLIDIRMSAGRLPHAQDLVTLLDAFKNSDYPILVHCQGGADRSGEATAIYKMIYMGASKEEALKMLTPEYMHIESKAPAKRYFIKHIWQGEDWARNEYTPCRSNYKYYRKDSGHCKIQDPLPQL